MTREPFTSQRIKALPSSEVRWEPRDLQSPSKAGTRSTQAPDVFPAASYSLDSPRLPPLLAACVTLGSWAGLVGLLPAQGVCTPGAKLPLVCPYLGPACSPQNALYRCLCPTPFHNAPGTARGRRTSPLSQLIPPRHRQGPDE